MRRGAHGRTCPVPMAIAHSTRFLSVPNPIGVGAWECESTEFLPL